MKTGINAFLLAGATTLVALGVSVIATSLWTGVVEVILGLVCFVVYEVYPA